MTASGWDEIVALAPGATTQVLEAYAVELERWNRTIRLVGPKDLPGIRREIVDSVLPFLHRPPLYPLLDIGSGAGLPGIALAAAVPAARVTCLEPLGKRTTFLRHVSRTLGMSDRVRVAEGRAEELYRAEPDLAAAFATVTARAVTDVESLLDWAAPYLASDGRAMLPRGPDPLRPVPGWALQEEFRYPAAEGRGERVLAIYTRSP